jgi:hypothetical protein
MNIVGLNHRTIFYAVCVASNNTRLFEMPKELPHIITIMATRRRNAFDSYNKSALITNCFQTL